MNQEIKTKWLQALRSGEYKQAQKTLKTNEGFCCLGVLCDLHAKETGNEWHLNLNGYLEYLNDDNILPSEVKDWAELSSEVPMVTNDNLVPEKARSVSLAYLNDTGNFSFEQLADIIEEQL